MSFLPQALRAGCIPFSFNSIPFFSRPKISSCESDSESSSMESELIEPEFSPYDLVLAQWAHIQAVLKEDAWYRDQGLSDIDEAKFAAVLSSYAKACKPLIQRVEKEAGMKYGMLPLPDGSVITKPTLISAEANSQIEADLVYLHKVILKFNECYQAFHLEPEKQKKSNFLFWFSLTLILMPVIAPLCAQIVTALAISASTAALFGQCFVLLSVGVQLYRFLTAHIQNERRTHLNEHKNILNQFAEQLEESLRISMNFTTRLNAMHAQYSALFSDMTTRIEALEKVIAQQPPSVSPGKSTIESPPVQQPSSKSEASTEANKITPESINHRA